jgi:hypothetical protein
MDKIKNINQGDVLTFKASDSKYKLILCTSINKARSPHHYTFAVLNYSSDTKPAINDILACAFWGCGNTKNDYFKYTDEELAKIWAIHPEIKPYFLGSYGLIIWRADFLTFRDNFELIANLLILDNIDKNGNGSMNVGSMKILDELFVHKLSALETTRGQKKFKVTAILK